MCIRDRYIIVPVLLAVVLVMMCHCTSDRKATVPANEYLIQGELADLSDSIVTVSYTHLDVYKRQILQSMIQFGWLTLWLRA